MCVSLDIQSTLSFCSKVDGATAATGFAIKSIKDRNLLRQMRLNNRILATVRFLSGKSEIGKCRIIYGRVSCLHVNGIMGSNIVALADSCCNLQTLVLCCCETSERRLNSFSTRLLLPHACNCYSTT